MPETARGGSDGGDPVDDDFRDRIQRVLDSFLDDQRNLLAPAGSDIEPLLEAAHRAVTGGKRLRPAFAYWGWRATGSAAESEPLMRVGAAIELVHASALVHDDVLDSSASRRGKPSAHKVFAAMRRTTVEAFEAERFGTAAAILLGDLLLGWSDELFSGSGFKPKALQRGRPYFDRLRSEVVAGQYLDVLSQTRSRASASDAMRVVRYKSAKYTVQRPLQLGAALGKASPPLLAGLSSYGIPLGEAFQLRDDVLGVFGEPAVTGKPAGDDIREGKRTLLLARAHDKADAEQRKVLERLVGKPDLDEAGVSTVRQVLLDTGALDAVETVIGELTSVALAELSRVPVEDDEARRALLALSDSVTNRAR